MPKFARKALHRPELTDALRRGEEKLKQRMGSNLVRVANERTIVRADSEHDWMYRLVSGWACRSRVIPGGRDQIILVFLPGDLFAMKSLFLQRHVDDIIALSDVVLERLHYQELRKLVTSDTDIAQRCMWQIVEEERRLHSWVCGLGQGSAEERLALLLIDFRGRLALAGVIASNALEYDIPLTQTQMADHLGITPVHVNRVLRNFRERGVLSLKDGRVTIFDLAALAKRAYPLLDAYERATPEYVGNSTHE